jgi:hypothetical protein
VYKIHYFFSFLLLLLLLLFLLLSAPNEAYEVYLKLILKISACFVSGDAVPYRQRCRRVETTHQRQYADTHGSSKRRGTVLQSFAQSGLQHRRAKL